MQLLASSDLPGGIVEIRIQDLPRHIKRGMERDKNGDRVKIGVVGTSRLHSAQFSISRQGTALIFTYTGPRISATVLENTVLKIVVPHRFQGFIDSQTA